MYFSGKQGSYRYKWIYKNELVANQRTFWTMPMPGGLSHFVKIFLQITCQTYLWDQTLNTTHEKPHIMLRVPAKNNNLSQQGLSFIGPKFWNILSSKIKLSTSANSFKHAIKEDFFSQLQKTENDPFVSPQNYRGRYSNLI